MPKKTATLVVSVPEDAEDPLDLVVDALIRYTGTTYPIFNAEYIDADTPESYLNRAVVVERVS